MLDQPAGILSKMMALSNVYNAFDSMLSTTMDQKKWSETYPSYWQIVARVQKLRMTHGS